MPSAFVTRLSGQTMSLFLSDWWSDSLLNFIFVPQKSTFLKELFCAVTKAEVGHSQGADEPGRLWVSLGKPPTGLSQRRLVFHLRADARPSVLCWGGQPVAASDNVC